MNPGDPTCDQNGDGDTTDVEDRCEETRPGDDPAVDDPAICNCDGILDTDCFSNNRAELLLSTPQLDNGGGLTAYFSALGEAFSMLSNDVQNVDEISLARSKYVFVFMSDGIPETDLGEERGGSDIVKLTGRWDKQDQYIESTDAHEDIALTYHAGEVNLVLDRTRKNPTYAVVELDGKPIPENARGASIVFRDGQTMVDIDAADLYHLVANGPKGEHVLTFHPGGAGVQAFAFTFGD
jgi:hypothetical protein